MAEELKKIVDQIVFARAWEEHRLEEENRALRRQQKEKIVQIDDELYKFFLQARRYFSEKTDAVTFSIGRPNRSDQVWKAIPKPVRQFLGVHSRSKTELSLQIYSGEKHILALASREEDSIKKSIIITTRVGFWRSHGDLYFDIRAKDPTPFTSVRAKQEPDEGKNNDIFLIFGDPTRTQEKLDIAETILAFAWSSAIAMAQKEHEAHTIRE